MGWCSGTEIFDDIAGEILEDETMSDETKQRLIAVVMDALENHDWDCQGESAYFEHPIVQRAYNTPYEDKED